MNEQICKKSKSEKALFKAIKKKFNDSKRVIDSNFIKTNAGFGLKSNNFKKIGKMLKMADALELEFTH